MITRVVHVNHEPYDVYCGRNSTGLPPNKWGNPFIIGIDGTREEVIALHMTYLRANKELLDSLHELDGKVLGCFCFPKKCHCDNYIEVLQEQKLFDF